MRNIVKRLVLASAIFLAGPALAAPDPTPARTADPIDEARTRLERGTQLYEEGAVDAARAEFQRAYELTKNWKILYNLATVSAQLHDFVGALRSFEAYLAQGGAQIPATRSAEVDKEIALLRSRVAKILVTTNVDGGEIFLDDELAGTAPLAAPLLVNPGKHKVSATAPGRNAATTHLTLAVGESGAAELELTPLPARIAAVPPPITRAEAPPKPVRTLPIVLWAGAGALAAGAGVTGALALGASHRLSTSRDEAQGDPGVLNAQRKNTQAFAVATDVLGAAALVTAGVALYFMLKPDHEPRAPASLGRVDVGVGPGNFTIKAQF
jgi:hypothetical protein